MKMRRDGRETGTSSFVTHIDRCLGCMACVTACPSGVQYDSLLEAARPQAERDAVRPFGDRLFRRLVFATFPHPGRLRWLSWPLALYQKLGLRQLVHHTGLVRLLPKRLQAMEQLLPPVALKNEPLPSIVHAEGQARRRVALLTGCVQRVFFAEVNRATARVLAAEGCDVIVPQDQECCGALAEHAGEEAMAKASARRLIDVFEAAGVDTIVINAAGCGSAMKRYGHLLRDDPKYKFRAEAFAAKCRDVSELLVELEPRAPRGPVTLRVAYHDACHLQHAQGVRAQPRKLLQQIPGIELREIPESEICCGSAGIYNLLEPEAATDLRTRKVNNVARTDADVVVSGNPGCLLQITAGLEAAAHPLPVMHLIEVIDRSIDAARQISKTTPRA
jgi:glycolate oxidase iron-sulfur subunit